MSKIKAFLVALVLVAAFAAPAMADGKARMGEIDLPTGVEIRQKDDLSSQMFRRILGMAWTAVAGEVNVPDGYGSVEDGPAATYDRFSELFPKILGIAGLIAATFASGFILYLAGNFALSTAHEGKKLGGSKMNSLWVPVRMCTGFGLSMPVYAGLTLLQWAAIAAVAFGISLANYTWREASAYIVANVSTGAKSVPPFVENEAKDLIHPTFQPIVVQELLKRRVGDGEDWRNPKIVALDGSTGLQGGISIQGDYIIEHKPREGRLMLWFMPGPGMALGSMGGVSIPAPIYNEDDLQDKTRRAEYDAMLQISYTRLHAYFQAAESLREHARYYVKGAGLFGTDEAAKALKPTITGDDIVREYQVTVADKSSQHIAFLSDAGRAKSKLANALGINASGDPHGGWMTAGGLQFILALATDDIDYASYGGGLQFVLLQDSMPDGTTDGNSMWSNFLEYIGWHTPLKWDSSEHTLIKGAAKYATQSLLHGQVYSGHRQDGDSQGLINRALTQHFYGGQLNNSGILATTLSVYADRNPIAATMWLGDRLIAVGLQVVGVSTAAAVVGMHPALGVVNEIVNNPVTLFFMGMLILVGGIFAYVLPIYFPIVWCQALWPWVIAVGQTLIAAPIWAVMHILPEGDGFAGQHARKGYVQLLDVAFRPFLLVVAVCFSFVAIQGAAYVVHQLFSMFSTGVATYLEISAISQTVWAIGVGTIVFLAIKTFTVDTLLKMPGQVIAWAGGIGMSMGSSESTTNESTTIIGGAVGGAGRVIGNAGSQIGGGRGGNDKDKGDKNKGPKDTGPASMAPKA